MNSVRLKIGGITFRTVADHPCDEIYWEENYGQFFYDQEDGDSVEVSCYYGQLPHISLTDGQKVFDTGLVWAAYKLEDSIAFRLREPGDHPRTYAIAKVETERNRVEVHYSVENLHIGAGGLLPQPLAFPLFQIVMTTLIPRHSGMLLHAAGVAVKGRGLLFLGSSGLGKTTMARLWGKHATILSDERIILRMLNGQAWIHGTPWHGELPEFSPLGVPLDAVFFLGPRGENRVDPINPLQALKTLLAQSSLPVWDSEGLQLAFDLAAGFVDSTELHELSFVPDESAVDFLRCLRQY
ncbi:hypothetical protein ACFL2Q_05055 [Thermodesulfobacteriota bacterium]